VRRHITLVIGLLLAVSLILSLPQSPVSADPGPALTLSSPAAVFLNEGFSLGLSFSNSGDATGFGPIVELIMPPQANFNGATYLGLAVNSINVGIFPAGGILLNPLTSEIVSGAAGSRLFILEYPLGSFTQDQPAAAVVASCKLTDNATLGLPFTIQANPIFRFGKDAVDNPVTDPPIHGDPATTVVTPTVIRLTKSTPIHEIEVSTGPNFPVTYTLTLDIADNCTLTNITVSDIIPGNLQFLNVVDAAGGSVTSAPSTITPGGTLSVLFSSVTGVVGADRVIQYRVYAPEKNDLGGDVLDPESGASTTAKDLANASGTYTGLTVGSSDNHTLNLRSLAIQKSVELWIDPQGNGISPADTLRYTVNFQVSDYFSMDNMTVTDNVTDGQALDISFIPTLSVTRGGVTVADNFTTANYPWVAFDNTTGPLAGITTIDFRVSQQLIDMGSSGILKGGLSDNRTVNVGATTGSIVFQTVIDDAYENPDNFPSGDPAIVAGDSTGNNVVTAAKLTGKPAIVAESSVASVEVVRPSLSKALYAINGDTNYATTNPLRLVGPGQTVTYSIRVTVPTADTENLTLTDYLPIPFLSSTELTFPDPQGDEPPPAGHWRVASDDTMTSFLAGRGYVAPVISTDGTENTIKFEYGTFDEPPPPPPGHWQKVIHILFTVTAQSNPMADALFLANLVNMTYHNSMLDSAAQASLTHIVTQEPRLVISKGVFSTDGGGTINPSPAIQPVTGDLTGANGGDMVTYVITVENQGSWPADNITVTEDVPVGLMSASVLSVVNGNGTALAYTGDLFAGGLHLTDPLAANNGTVGPPYSTDTALITISFRVSNATAPRQQFENTARVAWYQSMAGGQNFVQDPAKYQDKARVTIADPAMTKSIFSTSENSTTSPNLTIGENVTFKLAVTLPASQLQNLTITDTLPAGLGYITGSGIVGSSGSAVHQGTLTVTEPGGSGGNVIFRFAGLTAVDSDNNTAQRSFDIYLIARVLNEASNSGYPSATAKTNNSSLTWDGNPGAAIQSALQVFIVEPRLTITKSISPNPVDGGNPVTVTLRVTNNGTSNAFNVVVSDPLNSSAFDLASVTPLSTPAGFTYDYVSPTVTYNGGGIIVPTQTKVFTFRALVRPDIVAGTNYPNTATENYTSLPGTDPWDRTYAASVTTNLQARQAAATKLLLSTSEPADISSGNDVVIGEVLTYELKFDFPVGITDNVSLVDVLSTYVEYIPGSAEISRNSENLTASGFSLPAPNVFAAITPSLSSPLTFNLGRVTNMDTATGTKETITIRLRAVVKNIATVQRGTQIPNRGQITFTNGIGNRITVASVYINQFVNVPAPVVTKISNPVTVQGGQRVTFTVRAENQNVTRSAPLFNINVSDPLNASYHNIIVVSMVPYGPGINATNNSTSTQLNVDIDRLDPGEYLDITYTADLVTNIPYDGTISNSVLLTGSTVPGDHGTGNATPGDPGMATGKRTGTGGINDLRQSATAEVRVMIPSMDKTIVGAVPRYSIGETVTHQVTVSVPAGTTSGLRVADNLTPGLSYVPGSLFVNVPADVSTGNAPVEAAPFFTRTPASGTDPERLDFRFGSVTANSAASINITYQARVDNITANHSGTILGNSAVLYYIDPTHGEELLDTKTTSITVGLPELTLGKSITSNTAELGANENVTYQVVFGNIGQTTAYDIVFTDNISTDLDTITITTTTSTVSPTPVATVNVGNNSISMGPFDLPPGQTVTLGFRARLTDTVSESRPINNTAKASYATARGEGKKIMPPVEASVEFRVDSKVNVTKRLCASLPSKKFAIGETVIFAVQVDMAQGTVNDIVISDTLPAGLAFQRAELLSGNAGISYSPPSRINPSVSGQQVTFTWDNVTNPANGSLADDYFRARIYATVLNVAGNQDGTSLPNTGYVSWNGGPLGGQATNTLNISIIEPNLTISKVSDINEVTLGNQCTFTVRVRHSDNSTADAYDLRIVDNLPTHLSYVAGSCSLPASQVDVSGLPGTLVFNIPALTLADTETTFTYRCRVADTAPIGVDLVNRNILTYNSYYGDNPEKRTGAGGINDYRSESESTISTITRTTIHALKTVTDDNGSPVYAGDTLTYNIVMTNTGIPVSGATYTDLIPANTSYVPGSLWTDRGTVNESGNPLIVNVGTMNTGDVVHISFKVRINADLASAVTISNIGIVTSEQTSIKSSGPSDNGTISGPTDIIAIPAPAPPPPPPYSPQAPAPVYLGVTPHGSSVTTTTATGRALPPAPPIALPNFVVTKICVETQDKSDNVQVCLQNTTGESQDLVLKLLSAGVLKEPRKMTLSPHAKSCVSWSVPSGESASYRVNIGGLFEMDAPVCRTAAEPGPDRDTLIIIVGSLIILLAILVAVILRLRAR